MSQTKISKQIKELPITPSEKEAIIACLLGDGTLCQSGKHFRLIVEHAARHKDYLEWKYNFVKRLCFSGVRYTPSNNSWRFGTVGHPEITKLRHEWYRNSKQIVKDFRLTPMMLAIWFMDDGTRHRDTIDISVHNFSLESIAIIRRQLSAFGIETTVNSDSKGHRLYFKKSSYENFKGLVKPYIQQCMAYKLP
ncbi:MAG: hypothetical protein A3J48_00830 [Candidatus Doudnabacteria bacterium RIFCSPHIGHO2_02_FULL_46_11]|uniref:Homing endonuclease LAGLIDADG domain-containing protein n=1 Tax=Candidatus Doudnabacteria bacterium RIFCSPHIGHO2_02_FULL_46_11 TaxID=1817832 RepID=A0A1F5P8F1_9BACT|nr:MAG: hypothetical protein A3J48_00830 [Candidatus Doudnabacteria bacterium RIFCSPHIGHO2_02_FULL_46_11]